ncbi:MAG: MOSC N-terminal beta barrel domain-containing protein [Gammaproteobacteria bacterium]|nr:MOSC N-terminal beta barrel domain-containing protein [Gammaproteobacteria bacterium]NNJ79218.1 MOSC domain-containing protein [Xanthomonadales bacterium]NNK32171.1 MOSC domain-containing protein [Xanthomonadales bacterium]
MTSSLRITALTLYPVKSMRGIDVTQGTLTPRGLVHDRRFMVVREDGRFVTQRDVPKLALVRTALEHEGVVLSREDFGRTQVPFDRKEGRTVHTRVWGDACVTTDQGDELSRWLTAALESTNPLRLVAMAHGFERPQGKADLLGEENRTVFADAAPFLVTNRASLDRLNTALAAGGHDAVPMNRFRPNIVVEGLPAFGEHQQTTLASDDYALRLHYPCQRCIVTTIDQDSALKNPRHEPYRTLTSLNSIPGKDRSPAFGQNATLVRGEGHTIRVGDLLRKKDSI